MGQYLDLLGTARRTRDPVTADRIARYKSAKYTVERPLHLGAVLAAPARGGELLPALSAYGLPLGDAFQLRDDMLGAFGDEAVTGKPVGDDLREGKPTPLLAAGGGARRRPPAPGAGQGGSGRSRPGRGRHHPAGAARHRRRAPARGRITVLVETAVAALAAAPITPEARAGLSDLAHAVAWRER